MKATKRGIVLGLLLAVGGVSLTVAGAMETAGQFDNPKFKNGDFGLLDTNVGDIRRAVLGAKSSTNRTAP